MPKFNRLFIAEKGSAGKELAAYLGKIAGIPVQMFSAYAIVGQDVIAWMSGHLLGLQDMKDYDPSLAKWRMDVLPYVPAPFKLLPVIDFKTGNRKRAEEKITIIGKLLKDCTSVVGFGDPDAEGQLLQDELLIYLGNRKPVLRLWTNALDDKSLADALAAMRPNEEYVGWYEQALSRSESDWLFGINMTICTALHAQAAGAQFKVTIGRVQTPTLGLIVERELAIRNFKKVDYFVPYIGLEADPRFRASWFVVKEKDGTYEDPRVDLEGRLLNKADSDAIVGSSKAAKKATVVLAEMKPGTEAAPLPFSQSALQVHCSRIYGLSAKDTLAITQSLYLKKLTTYPRVDCTYLKESQHVEAPAILASLAKAPIPTAFAGALRGARPHLKSKAWNDAETTAHTAIIPTLLDNPAALGGLTDLEAKVYFEIAKRYVLQFWPAAKFEKTEVVLSCGNVGSEELFAASGKRYLDEGWRKAFDVSADDDEANGAVSATAKMPALTRGQVLSLFEAGAESKSTKAPSRFTDGTLVAAMANIHQYVKNPEYRNRLKEGKGIGTEATRANIIDGLVKKFLVTVEGKKKEFVPSEGAIELIQALPDVIRTPDMTAMWQQLNDEVRERRSTHAAFIAKLLPWLDNLVKQSATFFKPGQFAGMGGGNDKKGGGGGPVRTDTEFKCFGVVEKVGCDSPLARIKGNYGFFFGCSNSACKKTFREVGGKPVEKAPVATAPADPSLACKDCNKGFLRVAQRRDGTGSFWGCSNWNGKPACKAIFNDFEGKPDFEGKTARAPRAAAAPASEADKKHICAQCKKGFLRRVPRKGATNEFFWGCSDWQAGCKGIYNDLNGEPDIEGRGGRGGSGGPPRAPRSPGSGSRGRPSGYTTPTPSPR
jgi:DNA topoisomerase-3